MPAACQTTSLGGTHSASVNMDWGAVAPAARLGDQLSHRMAELIQRGEFSEGSRLPAESELADRFGVSRPVIREALSRLRVMGVIVSRKGSGSYVQRRAEVAARHDRDGVRARQQPRRSEEMLRIQDRPGRRGGVLRGSEPHARDAADHARSAGPNGDGHRSWHGRHERGPRIPSVGGARVRQRVLRNRDAVYPHADRIRDQSCAQPEPHAPARAFAHGPDGARRDARRDRGARQGRGAPRDAHAYRERLLAGLRGAGRRRSDHGAPGNMRRLEGSPS